MEIPGTPQKEVEVREAKQSNKQYFQAHPRHKIILVIYIIVSIFVLVTEPTRYWGISVGLIWFSFLLGWGVFSFTQDEATEKMENSLMSQFATRIGYTYSLDGEVEIVQGSIFDKDEIDSTQGINEVTDLVSGIDEGRPIKIYRYTYTEPGKDGTTFNYTVVETTFEGMVPHILVDEYEPVFYGKKLKFEGDFNKYFCVYGEKGFEMEVYELFTPDTMEQLVKSAKTVGFESIGNKLYVYRLDFVTTRVGLDELFSISKIVCKLFAPAFKSMEGDVRAMEEAKNTSH